MSDSPKRRHAPLPSKVLRRVRRDEIIKLYPVEPRERRKIVAAVEKFCLKCFEMHSAVGIFKGIAKKKRIHKSRGHAKKSIKRPNVIDKHKTLGTTPAVAAGVELEAWDLERVVEMTADHPAERGRRI